MVTELFQGDILKIQGSSSLFLVVSNDAFFRASGHIMVCPLLAKEKAGPLHIPVAGKAGARGVAVCEFVKLIAPDRRVCTRVDRVEEYSAIIEVSSALHALFDFI